VTDPEPGRGAIGDRIAGVILLILAVAAWWYARTFTTGFMQPVGPGAFPQLVSVPLGVLAGYLVLRPGVNQRWPHRAAMLRQAATIALLIGYAVLIEPWGFLPATLLATTLLMRQFGARWTQALSGGAPMTVGLYTLFEFALGMPLPDMPGLEW